MHHGVLKVIVVAGLIATQVNINQALAGTGDSITNWTWMKGSTNTYPYGTYGTRGTADPVNTPGGRDGAVAWTDGTGALWLFGGWGSPASGGPTVGGLNDLWKYDQTTMNWTWMKGANIVNQYGIYGTQGTADPANTPGARSGAVAWTDGTGALWLFGGLGLDTAGGYGYLNDLWKYNPATTNWTWIKGANIISQNGTYGTSGTADPANMPGGRDGAVAWTDGTGALWLFGGKGYPASGGYGDLNDLWKYDPLTTNWTWMKGSTNTDQYGICGTQGVPDPANTPGARLSAVAWTDDSDALWLFGGSGYPVWGGTGYLNDLWKYDPATTNWTWMKGSTNANQNGIYGTQGTADPVNTPGARADAVAWTDGTGTLWLFGGLGYPASGGLGKLNDLWKYDQTTMNWTWMKGSTNADQWETYGTQGVPDPANKPGARYSAVAWTDGTGALWLFGGFGINTSGGYVSSGGLNDLWKYDVSGSVVGPLITANGLVGDVYLNSGDAVTIAIQTMNIEPYLGADVDWWVVAFAHSGAWYYLDSTMQWMSFSGDLALCQPVYSGPLFNMSSTPVLNGFTLPRGTYDFWFAIDYPMDGILNLNGPILYDNVTVVVQ